MENTNRIECFLRIRKKREKNVIIRNQKACSCFNNSNQINITTSILYERQKQAMNGEKRVCICVFLYVTGGFNAFKSISSASMAHSNFRLSVLHRKHWMKRNTLENLCQVYFMLMKLRSFVVGTRKSSNVHDQTACFQFQKIQWKKTHPFECLSISVENRRIELSKDTVDKVLTLEQTSQVHEHSGSLFNRVIYLLVLSIWSTFNCLLSY